MKGSSYFSFSEQITAEIHLIHLVQILKSLYGRPDFPNLSQTAYFGISCLPTEGMKFFSNDE